MRLASKAAATRKFAETPGLFCQITQPEGKSYIAVPGVSSERRKYVPMGFLPAETKVTDLLQIVPDATLYHFGVLTSRMHNAWLRAVGGRLKSDYRYSKDLVYNTFVWPDGDTDLSAENGDQEKETRSSSQTSASSQTSKLRAKDYRQEISAAAQAVLDARALYPAASLAELYDPLVMPPELVKAHAKLDALVDRAYGRSFSSDSDRVAHLFRLYAERSGKVE